MAYETGDSFPIDEPRSPRPAPKAKDPISKDWGADLDEATAPDSMPVKTFALLIFGLALCAGLLALGLSSDHEVRVQRTARAPARRGQIQETVLSGPFGAELALPQEGPCIVNVFLEGCADCMPAFEAYSELDAPVEDLGVPVINVAYGRASEFSREYGLGENLVIDRGAALVRPLGISSFTTLVLDAQGRVRARLRPTAPDYRQRIADAVDAAW